MSSNRVTDPRAAERRRSILIMISAAVVLIVIAAAVIFWALPEDDESKTGGTAVPTVVTPTAGENAPDAIRLTGAPAGTTPPVVVTVFEDFICPACGTFEEQSARILAEYYTSDQVAIDYVPVGFLDHTSTTRYSTRAANASMCVAEATAKDNTGPGRFDKWVAFHNALFAQQPAEGGAGLDDDKLISIAKEVDVTGVSDCIKDLQFGQWIDENGKKANISSTPTVRINGKDLPNNQVFGAPLKTAIDAAVAEAK